MANKRASADNKGKTRRPKRGRAAFDRAQERKRKRRIVDKRGKYIHLSREPRFNLPTVAVLLSSIINMKNNADRDGWILVWVRDKAGREGSMFLCMRGFEPRNGKYDEADLATAIRHASTNVGPGKGAKP